MNITVRLGMFEADLSRPIDLSIPLRFNGPQPNAYGVEEATAEACEYGELVGDTRRGGSCNFEQVTLIPHCNGTHTECLGHVTDERISVRDCLQDVLMPAALISVSPVSLPGSSESYPNRAEEGDQVITSGTIREALDELSIGEFSALIVRTLPNSEEKLSRLYRDEAPPYFTTEAILLLDELGIDHLICDLPSIDRLYDGGGLSNHRTFWKIGEGMGAPGPDSRRNRTVTELMYAPKPVRDGLYLLDLQIAPFQSDAAPSRPLIFRLIDIADRPAA